MTTEQLYRLSGFALVVGAILATVQAVLSGVLFPESNSPAAATSSLNILLSLIGVIGTLLLLLGLPGMYARAAGEGGALWLVGTLLIGLTGILFGVFFGLLSVMVFPVLATRAPDLFGQGPPESFFPFFIIATLANVIGAIAMGVVLLRTRVYARWLAYVMFVEAVFAVLGFVANGPSSTGLLSQILNLVSPLPLFLVLGWAGYELWSGKAPASEAIARPTVAQPA
jgi:hypothetical protein